MPIVITPSGEYVDDQTGMPVDPRMIQQLDPRSSARQGEAMGGVNLDPRSVVREGEMTGGAVMPQIPDPMSVVRSEEEMLYLDRLKAIKEMDPGAVAREGEDVVMERMFPGSVSDPRSVVREGEMARENIPANMDMGMNSEMAAADLSDVDKVRMLIDMGLSPQEAMEAIGREKAMEVRPQEFGVPTQDPGMGALSGVPAGNQAPMPMPMPRPEDLMQRQMPMGRDRTFNPNDMLRPDNAPNT